MAQVPRPEYDLLARGTLGDRPTVPVLLVPAAIGLPGRRSGRRQGPEIRDGDSMSDYNYSAFSFAMDGVGVDRWLNEGPQAGEKAPPFSLPTLGGDVIELEDLAGRPVVLEFGSYTCPIFCGHIPAMENVARRHPEAAFLVIYTREAHPGEITPEHRSVEAKQAAA